MKKKILTVAVLVICLALLASGTIAYYTAEDRAHNVITSSAVDIAIEEWQETEEGLVPYPKDKPIEIMPGTTVSKIAAVKSLEADSFIRATIEIIVKDTEGKEMDISPEALASIVTVTMNGEDWLRKDGDAAWWYYADEVACDQTTQPLFTQVVFDGPNMTNEYQNCTVEIIVTAQAVQAANNGQSALDANGWPKE